MNLIAQYRFPLMGLAVGTSIWGIALCLKGIKPWTPEWSAFKRTPAGFLVLWGMWSSVWSGWFLRFKESVLGPRASATTAFMIGILFGFVFAAVFLAVDGRRSGKSP